MKSILKLSFLVAVMLLIATCQREEEGTVTDDLQLKKAGGNELSIEGKYIVVFKDQVANPRSEAENLKAVHGLKLGHVYEHCLRGFSASIPPVALEGLMRNPKIDYIEPDKIISIDAQTIPTGISRMAINTSPFAKIDGVEENMDVDVAVIDTGVDADHPDLNVAGGVRFYNLYYTDNNYNDDHGHGSHVAGTIGAIDNGIGVVGVAPGARIWAVKVLSSSGSGYLSDIIKGIDWVRARATTIEVINMSIGGKGYSSSYRTAITNCVNAGIVVMVAAGNEATDVYGADGTFGTKDDRVPAAFPEAAAISALADSNGQLGGGGPATSYGSDDSFASFSNYSRSVVSTNPVNSPGKAIDLLLPGVSIYSCYMNGGYATMSGTSMASPHAAGLAALYIAEKGRATNAAGVYAIRQLLIDKGKLQTDPEGLATQNDPDGFKEKLGWVILNTPLPNQPPVANAGPDQTVNDGDNSGDQMVSLNGSGSADDKGITAYSWKEGDLVLSSQVTANVAFSTGVHQVVLTVSDAEGLTASDAVTITVNPNQAPTAAFSATTSGLNATFTDLSNDPDGTITARAWNFGDGVSSTVQNPSHTYASAGSYTVSLTVTDSGGLTGNISESVTVSSPANIVLTVVGYKVKNQKKADLTWSPSGIGTVDIYRDGSKIITTLNDGFHTDNINQKSGGTFTYKVCITGTSNCSNEASVVF
jgi:subtilisin family serine protease